MAEDNSEEPPHPDVRLTTVFTTGDAGLIAVARSLLDAEGIEYLVRGDGLQDLFGMGRIGADYNFVVGPAEFVVTESDAERAHELLDPLLTAAAADESSSSEPL